MLLQTTLDHNNNKSRKDHILYANGYILDQRSFLAVDYTFNN